MQAKKSVHILKLLYFCVISTSVCIGLSHHSVGLAQKRSSASRPKKKPPAPLPKPTPYYIAPVPTPTPRPLPQPKSAAPIRPFPPVAQPIPTAARIKSRGRSQTPDIGGLKRFYYVLGVGGRMNQLTQLDTAEKNKSKVDQTFALTDYASIGWGTAKFYDFYVNAHYMYSQDWGTTADQVTENFFKKWFNNHKAEDFIFPTKSLIRTHEFTLDTRYVVGQIQLGLLSRLWWARVGSSTFGSDAEVENASTSAVGENFVPYLSFRYEKFYQGEIAFPLQTELNKDDENLSNKTYDFTTRGRGRVFSYLFNNRFNFQKIRSILYSSLYYYEFKYNAVQFDKTRFGLNLSLDFPVAWKLRAAPRFAFYMDTFYLPRIRINQPDPEVKRKDTALTFGFLGYIDFNKAHRLKGEFSVNSVESTITEHNSNLITFSFGYSWSFPNTLTVTRKIDRFKNDIFSEEY